MLFFFWFIETVETDILMREKKMGHISFPSPFWEPYSPLFLSPYSGCQQWPIDTVLLHPPSFSRCQMKMALTSRLWLWRLPSLLTVLVLRSWFLSVSASTTSFPKDLQGLHVVSSEREWIPLGMFPLLEL